MRNRGAWAGVLHSLVQVSQATSELGTGPSAGDILRNNEECGSGFSVICRFAKRPAHAHRHGGMQVEAVDDQGSCGTSQTQYSAVGKGS